MRQLLHHIGEIGEDSLPKWKTDMYKGDILEALTHELTQLADDQMQKPRDHAAVVVLNDIAAKRGMIFCASVRSATRVRLSDCLTFS